MASVKEIIFNCWNSLISRAYSSVIFVADRANWVLSWEIREIRNIVSQLNIRSKVSAAPGNFRQCVFLNSKYFLLKPDIFFLGKNRIAFPYFHGYPTRDNPVLLGCYENLKRYHHKISRIQVSHRQMRDIILDSGIDPSKIFLIPIGINSQFFTPQAVESKREARQKYDIPQDAVVIGSFQKDGVGWGGGLEPKLEKGPDVFLRTVRILKESVPELFILLSGPARGYVKRGLDQLDIPYKHIYLQNYPEVGHLYHCLDAYIVASREEGGPKAILESMASGVPLITTRVGQAMDLVKHGENGFMVDVEDAEGLAYWAKKTVSDSEKMNSLLIEGFKTAAANTYSSQVPLWADFFRGFVDKMS